MVSLRPLAPILLLAAGLALASPVAAAGSETAEIRTLVIILDAVPFDTVDRLIASRAGDDPLFAGFQPPLPLISAFPSSTSVAMGGLLQPFGLTRSPGYEARFFDWEQREVVGGGLVSFFRIDFAWRRFFDWSRKGVVRSALSGARPVAASGSRVEKAVEAFFKTDRELYFVYLETTDLAAHLKGPDELERVLVRLDAALVASSERHPDTRFRTVIFSDHGVAGDGTGLKNAWPGVRRAARDGGFRLKKRLRQPDDLVLIPFGLVSSFEAYVESERTPSVASALVTAEGVDLCVYRTEESLVVEDRDGRARVDVRERDDAVVLSYSPDSSDPLEYGPLAAGLEGTSGDRFAHDARWFEATVDHFYPDALYRISRAFDLVDNPASVLCSLEPGYMYGMPATERLARATGSRVKWTHGALFREATLGFLLTDDERFPANGPLRFDRALLPLTEERPESVEEAAAVGGEGWPHDKMPWVLRR